MKLDIIVVMVAIVLIAATLSAFGIFDYLNAGTEDPAQSIGTIIINTSALYHTDEFSWYTYIVTENHAVYGEQTYNWTFKSEFGDALYNDTLSKRWRNIITYSNSSITNITEFQDSYWDAAGLTFIATQTQSFADGMLIHEDIVKYNNMGPYQKQIFWLPYGSDIDYDGAEKVTIDNTTYDCRKYYLGTSTQGYESAVYNFTYWFNDSIPVPVKLCHDGRVTYELAGWG